MGMFSLDEQPEYLELERQVKELKEQLRIAKEGRHFFYQDAKAYHDMAMRLKQENSKLRVQLAAHTNPEDTYRDDFDDIFMDELEIICETYRRC